MNHLAFLCPFILLIFESYGLENSVIDISHHNKDVDFKKIKNDGIKAVIHKASQGIMYKDPKYGIRKSEAESHNLLWGAYHFGTNHNGSAQARHFLKTVDCGCGNKYPLLVLDIEENEGNTMSLDNAQEFVRFIKEMTGACPVIYGGYYLKQLVKNMNTILTSCPLWLSQYAEETSLPDGWSHFSLWQYTDGSKGPDPKTVQGVGKVDRNKFNDEVLGSIDTFWNGLRGTRMYDLH